MARKYFIPLRGIRNFFVPGSGFYYYQPELFDFFFRLFGGRIFLRKGCLVKYHQGYD
jgi:hypothetical protein